MEMNRESMPADVLARHRAFWTRAPAAEALLSRLPERRWQARPYPLRGGGWAHDSRPITPDDVDVERLVGTDQPLPPLLKGDLVNSLNSLYPAAWLEGVAGCPIHVSAFGCVARPAVRDVREAAETFSLARALASPWLNVMDAVLDRAAAKADGAYPVAQLHLRGVIDLLAAYLGEEALCLAVYDDPDRLAGLADQMADLYLAVAERGAGRRAAWQSGSVSCWEVYAPGRLADYQIDASSLFPADLYARHFARFDAKVLRAYPYSVFHLHSVGLHLLPVVLETDGVRAVEINLDREAGDWNKERMLRCCQQVQAAGKSLILFAELSDVELAEFMAALDPAGLAIESWARSTT